MNIRNTLGFVFQSVAIGLALAFLIIQLWPDVIHNNKDNIDNGQFTTGYRTAVSSAAPAVVNVYASQVLQQRPNPLFQDPLFQQFFGVPEPSPNRRRDSNLGSGVIMNQKGYILTNAHVISGKEEIMVTLFDGRQGDARIIGIDTDTDLAVIQIEMEDLPVIRTGNSDELYVGDVVLAIGNPYGFGQTVTQGIVSAKGRKRMGITTFEDFIQTDADINPGNSGGALVNSSGELVGINTAIISNTGGSQGIGLATPVNLARNVMTQIIEKGHVIRGWLGIEAQVLPPDFIKQTGLIYGVLVAGVLQNGPADEAGIIPGDIILMVDGDGVSSPQQAIELIANYKPGSSIELTILREWEQKTVKATVATRPSFR